MTVTQHCKCNSCHWIIPLKTAKTATFRPYIFTAQDRSPTQLVFSFLAIQEQFFKVLPITGKFVDVIRLAHIFFDLSAFSHGLLSISKNNYIIFMESQALFKSTWIREFNSYEKYLPYHPYFTKGEAYILPSATQQVRAHPEFSQAPKPTVLTITLKHPWNSAIDTLRELVKNHIHNLYQTDWIRISEGRIEESSFFKTVFWQGLGWCGLCLVPCRILVPWSGIEPAPLALGSSES